MNSKIEMKPKIQTNKQEISSLKAANDAAHDARMAEEISLNRVNMKWTKDECSLAVLGFRKFGQNFKVTSSMDAFFISFFIQNEFAGNRRSSWHKN